MRSQCLSCIVISVFAKPTLHVHKQKRAHMQADMPSSQLIALSRARRKFANIYARTQTRFYTFLRMHTLQSASIARARAAPAVHRTAGSVKVRGERNMLYIPLSSGRKVPRAHALFAVLISASYITCRLPDGVFRRCPCQ